jgi:hypothetical protein
MKELILIFRELGLWTRDYLFYRRCAIRVSLAIRLADMKLKAMNRRQWVLPIDVGGGAERLKVFDNRGFERMKRAGWLPRRMNFVELCERCVYMTPLSRINKTDPEERRKAREKYLRYSRRFLRERKK